MSTSNRESATSNSRKFNSVDKQMIGAPSGVFVETGCWRWTRTGEGCMLLYRVVNLSVSRLPRISRFTLSYTLHSKIVIPSWTFAVSRKKRETLLGLWLSDFTLFFTFLYTSLQPVRVPVSETASTHHLRSDFPICLIGNPSDRHSAVLTAEL